MHKVTICPTGFSLTFVALHVLNHWLREILLLAIANNIAFQCQSKTTDAIVLQSQSCFLFVVHDKANDQHISSTVAVHFEKQQHKVWKITAEENKNNITVSDKSSQESSSVP